MNISTTILFIGDLSVCSIIPELDGLNFLLWLWISLFLLTLCQVLSYILWYFIINIHINLKLIIFLEDRPFWPNKGTHFIIFIVFVCLFFCLEKLPCLLLRWLQLLAGICMTHFFLSCCFNLFVSLWFFCISSMKLIAVYFSNSVWYLCLLISTHNHTSSNFGILRFKLHFLCASCSYCLISIFYSLFCCIFLYYYIFFLRHIWYLKF